MRVLGPCTHQSIREHNSIVTIMVNWKNNTHLRYVIHALYTNDYNYLCKESNRCTPMQTIERTNLMCAIPVAHPYTQVSIYTILVTGHDSSRLTRHRHQLMRRNHKNIFVTL